MTLPILLALVCIFPRGSKENPGVVAPLVPSGDPVSFWWDDTAFHVGTNAYIWSDLNVKPKDGVAFKLPLGVFDHEPIVLDATLDSRSHRLRIGSAGPIGDKDVKLAVNVEGAFDDTLRCKFRAMGQTPDYIDVTKQGQVKSGATTDFVFLGHGSQSGEATIEITGGEVPKVGRTVTQDDMGTIPQKASLKRIIYSSRCNYRKYGLLFDYQYVWTDRDKAKMHIVSKNWSKQVGGGCSMRVSAKDLKTMTMGTWTKTTPMKILYGEKEDSVFDVGDLPEGFYWMIVEYLDSTGNVLNSDRFRYFKPPIKMPWEGTELGNEDTVPPPWTPPTFRDDGTFSCWNRVFHLGGAGLVRSIVNGGREMLSEPIAILLNGRPLEFDVSLLDRKIASATYRLTAKGAPIVVDAICEFDGYVRFVLSYGEGVSSLAWRVSLDRSQVVAFDDGRGNDTQDLLNGGRCLDRYLDIDRSRFWWVGGVHGLCGGLNTLRGLHVKNLNTGGHVRADTKVVSVTTMLVDEPYSGALRTVRFYVEPTPMKPKNMDIATCPAAKLVGWTGFCCEYYEMKYPGFEIEAKFKKFSDKMKDGCRVFFYNATHAYSPDSPFHGWYGTDWINDTDPGGYAHEAPIFSYPKTKKGRWRYGCTNSKSYFESKLWGIDWYFNNPVPEMKDLYFDVCNPAPCYNTNAFHACRFVDDFGRLLSDADFDATRDLHKRVYRLVKSKNADGAMYGHLTRARKPTDAFFDYCCMGEFLAWKVRWQDSYYEILTPELMQSLFVPRSTDMLVGINAQFRRWRQCWAPELMKNYNPEEPKLQKAIRHFTAYALIHSLFPESGERPDILANKYLSTLGKERRSWHYYDEGEHPVTLSVPGARQLWALYRGNGKAMLIILNDTDKSVVQTVRVKGLSAKGKELLFRPQRTYDFSTGSCTFELGPRECRFILWDKSESVRASMPSSVRAVSRINEKDRHGIKWWSKRFERNLNFIRDHRDDIDFVFAGSSSVHFWETRGKKEYEALTNRYVILNCGYRGDTTQTQLWRFQNGELDGYRTKGVLLSIGSNNNGFKGAKVSDTVAGIKACLLEIKKRQPEAKIVLLAFQPRAVGTPDGDPSKDNGANRRNRETSAEMAKMADGESIFYVDVYDKFLVDGKLPKSLSADYIHPTEKGYGIIREALEPILEKVVTSGEGPLEE